MRLQIDFRFFGTPCADDDDPHAAQKESLSVAPSHDS